MNQNLSNINTTVCVAAINKDTGYIETCTSCNGSDIQKHMKHYRKIGYRSKVYTYEELGKAMEREVKEHHMMNCKL